MFARRRCSFCHRWFYPHPRLKQRQKTCGQSDCRRKQKQKSNRQWRTKYRDYFRGSYEHQRKSTERVPTTSAATVSNIPTTCGATRLSSKNVACG